MPAATETIRKYYQKAFEALDGKRGIPEIDVQYYPYVGINHTIRVREGRVYVRIAEICREMPHTGHQALAYILVAKLMRKKVPAQARDVYSQFIRSAEVREKATARKREHGRKVITTHKGEVYDLDETFRRLNREYFAGRLKKPVLTWSARKTYRVLGHHDSTHQTVVVSKSLDSPDVPSYVVDYIVFHEMLHIHHPTRHINGRRYNHTPAFRRDEQKFAYYNEAERWIERNVRKLKKAAKKK